MHLLSVPVVSEFSRTSYVRHLSDSLSSVFAAQQLSTEHPRKEHDKPVSDTDKTAYLSALGVKRFGSLSEILDTIDKLNKTIEGLREC